MAITQLTIKEFKEELKDLILYNRKLQEKGIVPLTIGVQGHAGIGKTSAIIQVALELGIDRNNIVRMNLAEVEELGDIVGFCLKEYEVCKETKCEWINEHLIDHYLKLGYQFTGNKRMSYAPPEKIQGKGENGILILDDFLRADPRFAQACMTLMETHEYYSWKLPKGWTIVISNNPDNGDYHVNAMDPAQRSRFLNYEVYFEKNCWAEWAEREGIDTRFINFILLYPELLEGIGDKKNHNRAVNPRSAVMFSYAISGLEDFSTSKSLEIINRRGEATVGPEFANHFVQFINNKLDKLPSPEYMMTGKWDDVKQMIFDVVGKNSTYRADIASVLSLRIINWSLAYAEKNPIDRKLIDRLIALSTEDLFTKDLQYAIVREIFNGNRVKFKQLTLDKTTANMIMI